MSNVNSKEKVLSVKDLVVHFSTDHGYVQAVRGISFDLYKGETLCIVGESGSGKSVTSKSIMGILAANGRIKGGEILYEGEDLTKVSEDEFHRIRGHKIGMIFQDPLSSLNPIVRIGKQITEAMLINSSRLKKLYQEKISEKLVAYKNAETAKRAMILNAKDAINFLKVDSIKVGDSYMVHHQEVNAEIYKYEKEIDAQLNELSKQYNESIKPLYASLDSGKLTNEEAEGIKQQLSGLKKEYKASSAALKKQFSAFKRSKIKARISEYFENKKHVKEIHKEYKAKIVEAKQNYKIVKVEANEKYNDLIAETKEAYKIRCKEAKKEVAEFKKELIVEYNKKVAAINLQLKEHLERLVEEHSKSLETIPATEENLLREAKKIFEMKVNLAKENAKKDLDLAKETYIKNIKITKAEAKERALKIMAEVGIPYPEKRFKQYPFEFSGGMRQRIVIAIALTADPDILICDEPTTALDVTIQAQILELINRLKETRNLSCIFITHDLGVVANMADRVAVMYAGKIVEYGLADEIFYDPRHPYTWALLSSIPDVDSKERLDAIPGTPPNMIYPPKGDAFALRSKYAMKIDFEKEPPLFKVSDTHYAATWLLDPRAPKVEMPSIVKTRIENSLKNAKKGDK